MKTFRNLVEMQEHSCREHRDREMYGTKKNGVYEWITYGDFAEMADEIRGGLAHLGVSAGDKVAIIANNCVEWPVCAYAVYGLGAHYVPMYESQSIEDWEYIINDSGAKVLLVRTESLLRKVTHLPEKIVSLRHIALLRGAVDGYETFSSLRRYGKAHPIESYKPSPDEPFGLIYTSGTTGKPKGVILTHGNLMAELDSVADLLDFSPEDRSLSFLPWGHLMGQIEEVHFLILKGFSAAITDNILDLMTDFQAVAPTIFFTVPKVYQRFYDAVNQKIAAKGGAAKLLFEKAVRYGAKQRRGEGLSFTEKMLLRAAQKLVLGKISSVFGGRLRMSMCGGAALNPEVIGFLEDLGVTVYEGYGLTETTMAISANSLHGKRYGSVGRALQGAKIVLDETVKGAGKGEGEIIVYGPHITAGYHNQPDLFLECLTLDGGFRTGDIGRFDEDGYLYITGRVKELYKLANGKYVAPAPLEEQLRQSPLIGFAMLYGDNRPYNVAIVVPEPSAFDPQAQGNELRKQLESEIDKYSGQFRPYEKPKKLVLVQDEWTPENGMLTPTLKIKRATVLKKYMPIIEEVYK
jgi:long-chain acyl-CoA synthetase